MLRLAEDLQTPRPACPIAANPILRTSLLTLVTVFALAPTASADGDHFDALLPQSLGYQDFERRPPSLSFRRDQSRAVEAPTRYHTSSILKYSTPIGNTGLIFRVKAGPNPRRLVKLEIRF